MSVAHRAIVFVGGVWDLFTHLDRVLPGRGDDWAERDYTAAVARTELELAEEENEVLEPGQLNIAHGTSVTPEDATIRRIADVLGPAQRDAEWRSAYGTHWRWAGDRWARLHRGEEFWAPTPVGYIPQASGPFTEVVAQPAMDWLGWCVPAILEVLAEHEREDIGEMANCACGERFGWAVSQWAEHVAPLIAERIACDPQRAAEALQRYKV